jgi:soluble lytic murein transglycosylase-like protein
VLATLAGDAVTSASASAPPDFVRVLSDQDVSTYRALFAAAAKGDKAQMGALAAQLKNKTLMGHVTAKGYLSPQTAAAFDDLKAWLNKYPDYPEAERIFALAERKAPQRVGELKPATLRVIRGLGEDANEMPPEFTDPQATEAAGKLRAMISTGQVNGAMAYVESADVKGRLSKSDYGKLAAAVAAGHYYLGDARQALALAERVAQDSRADVPDADWVAGLAAFKLKQYDIGAMHFAAMADNPSTTSWLKAAAAFWAARCFMASQQPQNVSRMLQIAADKPRTFYGLIALRLLGKSPPFTWSEPTLERAGFRRLIKVPGIARGVALYQVGEMENAEGSIARAHGHLSSEMDRPFIALAHELGFAHIQLLAAGAARSPDLKAAAYPVMNFKPTDGWTVDPALVHAIVRQESKFEMRVTSTSEARGLMQLLPSTAAGVMKDTTLDNPGAKARLFDPAFNLSVGQRYLAKMFDFAEPNGNLFHLVVAYNAGPGNLQKWLKEIDFNGDPLLFIESIPSRETRGYVERVVSNYWIYQDRMGAPQVTLDQVARGEWPVMPGLGHHRVAALY